LNSLKLQQVGAEISEKQKLQQPAAELGFPTMFGYVNELMKSDIWGFVQKQNLQAFV
jgi:hypothetical protein